MHSVEATSWHVVVSQQGTSGGPHEPGVKKPFPKGVPVQTKPDWMVSQAPPPQSSSEPPSAQANPPSHAQQSANATIGNAKVTTAPTAATYASVTVTAVRLIMRVSPPWQSVYHRGQGGPNRGARRDVLRCARPLRAHSHTHSPGGWCASASVAYRREIAGTLDQQSYATELSRDVPGCP